MNNLLLGLTFLLFFLSLKTNDDDFASPSVVFSLCFFMSSLLLALNTFVWNYEISSTTVIILSGGILFFWLGCQSRKRIKLVIKKESENGFNKRIGMEQYGSISYFFSIPFTVTLLAICVELVSTLIRLLSIRSVTGSLNVFSNTILKTYRAVAIVPYGTLLKLLSPLVEVIALIYLLIISDCLVYKKRIRIINLVPILFYISFCALSSSRIEIIYLVVIFLAIYLVVYRTKTKKNLSLKQFILLSFAIVAGVFLFFGLGFLTGKSQSQVSISDNIAMYAASSIPAFDNYIQNFTYEISNLGTLSFFGLTNFLSYFGLTTSHSATRNAEFVMLGSMKHMTNIYTCFRPLLIEYNYVGMLLVLFLEGRIFQSVYQKACLSYADNGNPNWLIFYAYSVGYLSLSSIAERVFTSWLTITTAIFSLFLFSFTKLYCKRERKSLNYSI